MYNSTELSEIIENATIIKKAVTIHSTNTPQNYSINLIYSNRVRVDRADPSVIIYFRRIHDSSFKF